VNSGFERLTGYSAAEVLGRNCRFLQGPDTDPDTAAVIRRALSERRECTVEILNYRKDGTTFWNRLSLTPVRDHHGQVTNYIGVQSDVTARRRAEDNLRAANRYIRAGLEAGARIQQALLPQSPPVTSGLNIDWQFVPCDELAGDIFNVFRLDGRQLVIYLLDVSGHGVPAALLSVTLSRFLSPGGEWGGGPSLLGSPLRLVNQLNRQFPFGADTQQFFTILYGVFDVTERTFRYVSAGHPPLAWVDAEGQSQKLQAPGLPVGIEPEPGYQEHMVRLAPGERLFLYTDGLLEARDPRGTQFGEERLLATLVRPEEALKGVLQEAMRTVQQWAGAERLEDDASILGVEATENTNV
jgi:PAS domain S-box-containing protein